MPDGPSSADYKRAGEGLLAVSEAFGGLAFDPKQQRVEIVVAAMVLRARGLVRAAYQLADAEDFAGAGVFLRALTEYAITLRWLLLDPPRNLTIWAIDDLRNRLLIGEVAERLAGVEVLEADMRAKYQDQKRELEEDWRATIGDPVPKRIPSLETRARETGNVLMYGFAYRFESQTAVHPTGFAVDQMLEETDGKVRVADGPVRATYADPYGVAGAAFLDILDAAGEAVPEFDHTDETKSHREVLHASLSE